MIMVNDRTNGHLQKQQVCFAEAQQTEGEEEKFWMCGGEAPDLHKTSLGAEG